MAAFPANITATPAGHGQRLGARDGQTLGTRVVAAKHAAARQPTEDLWPATP